MDQSTFGHPGHHAYADITIQTLLCSIDNWGGFTVEYSQPFSQSKRRKLFHCIYELSPSLSCNDKGKNSVFQRNVLFPRISKKNLNPFLLNF